VSGKTEKKLRNLNPFQPGQSSEQALGMGGMSGWRLASRDRMVAPDKRRTTDGDEVRNRLYRM
jgi:hypothetical protein